MFCDMKSMLKDKEILSLISQCVYQPTENKMHAIAERYSTDENANLVGYMMDNRIVGCAGVNLSNIDKPVLMHIAVDPAYRKKGVGRKIINELVTTYSMDYLEAETDDDAVEFYRRCDFHIVSLGEKYPGTIRYKCILRNFGNSIEEKS